MTKPEIIKSVADAAGISQTQAKAAYEKLATLVVDTVSKGETFAFAGVGTLKPATKAARSGKSALNGKEWSTPESVTVRFKPAKPFIESLNS